MKPTIGSLAAIQRLRQVCMCIGCLQQGHLDGLGSLQELEVVSIRGHGKQLSQRQQSEPGAFPRQLAVLPSLRVVHITLLTPGVGRVCKDISCLSKLEELHLILCGVTRLPEETTRLTHLHTLQLRNACESVD